MCYASIRTSSQLRSRRKHFANVLGQTADLAVANVRNRNTPRIGIGLFNGLLLLLVAAAIVRSAIATRLDGFTVDEAYHIAAGVYYVRLIFGSTQSILLW
jgi:hypothetical protein